MGALTPDRLSPPDRSPCLTQTTFLTIPTSTTRCSPVPSFIPATLFSAEQASWLGRNPFSTPLPAQVWASPFPSRLAEITRPNQVRYPSDWSFTSCCSPPCLTATQLHSVTGCGTFLKRTCTSLMVCARRRTRAGHRACPRSPRRPDKRQRIRQLVCRVSDPSVVSTIFACARVEKIFYQK